MLKIPQVVEFPYFSQSGMGVHFIPFTKDKIRTVRKKSGRLVTLYREFKGLFINLNTSFPTC
jgi:hypothetical protein